MLRTLAVPVGKLLSLQKDLEPEAHWSGMRREEKHFRFKLLVLQSVKLPHKS